MLVNNDTITSLSLRATGIAFVGVECLADALKKNSSLMELDLSDNPKIGDEGEFEAVRIRF